MKNDLIPRKVKFIVKSLVPNDMTTMSFYGRIRWY